MIWWLLQSQQLLIGLATYAGIMGAVLAVFFGKLRLVLPDVSRRSALD